MSIENPTLVHFRHFSSLLTNLRSTTVENSLQITPFYAKQTQFKKWQNEHKYLHNNVLRNFKPLAQTKKQTQFKPNKAKNKPNLTQFKANLTQNKANRRHRKPMRKPLSLRLLHLTYNSRLLNWIKSRQLLKSVKTAHINIKNQLFMTVSRPEEIISCQLTVAHFSKAQ